MKKQQPQQQFTNSVPNTEDGFENRSEVNLRIMDFLKNEILFQEVKIDLNKLVCMSVSLMC